MPQLMQKKRLHCQGRAIDPVKLIANGSTRFWRAKLEIRQAPQPAFTCRDMDATDLYGRVHVGVWAG